MTWQLPIFHELAKNLAWVSRSLHFGRDCLIKVGALKARHKADLTAEQRERLLEYHECSGSVAKISNRACLDSVAVK